MKIKLPDVVGFDIVVWQKKKASETYCASYTAVGTVYLDRWFRKAKIFEIYEMGIIHPKDFIGQAPVDLKIGGLSPGSKAAMRINPSPLH